METLGQQAAENPNTDSEIPDKPMEHWNLGLEVRDFPGTCLGFVVWDLVLPS